MELNLFGARPRPDPDRLAQVRQWAAELLAPAGASVMVTELACAEEGCPPLETVVVVMEPGRATRQYKLFKAVAELTRADLVALCAPASENPRHE